MRHRRPHAIARLVQQVLAVVHADKAAGQDLRRRHEFQADAFAARLTGDADGLALALARLSADNLAEITAHPLTVLLSASHPPVLERIRALDRLPHPAKPLQ